MSEPGAGGGSGGFGAKLGWIVAVLAVGAAAAAYFAWSDQRVPPPFPRIVRFLKPRTDPPPVQVEEKVEEAWRPVVPQVDAPFTGWFVLDGMATDVRVAIDLDGVPGFDGPGDARLDPQPVPEAYFEYVVGLAGPRSDPPITWALGEWAYAKADPEGNWNLLRHDVTIKE